MLQLICFQLLSFVEFICSFLNHRQNVKVKLLNVMEKKKTQTLLIKPSRNESDKLCLNKCSLVVCDYVMKVVT